MGDIVLNGLVVRVAIGCTAAERSRLSPIQFDFAIGFRSLPRGCRSDRLQETVCYATVCRRIQAIARAKDYALLEHLAHEVEQGLRKDLPSSVRLGVRVTKLRPPIPGVKGTVSFRLGDPSLRF